MNSPFQQPIAPANSLQMSAGVNTVADFPAQPAQTLAPIAPVAQPLAPIEQPAAQVGTAVAGTCAMNAHVVLETRAVIQLPWGVLADRFDYAFIGKSNQLVVSEHAPVFNQTTDDWEVEGETIVFGSLDTITAHWRESLTIRPDTEEVVEEVEKVVEAAPACYIPVAQPPVAQPPVTPPHVEPKEPDVKRTIDTSNMSRGQLKRHKAKMARLGFDENGKALPR